MRFFRHIVFIAAPVMLFLTAPSFSQSSSQAPPPPQQHVAKASKTVSATRDGETVFQQNCSRCHNAPDGFSSRISGTIAPHMRVRASLSREDEQALIKFLNP